MVRWGVIVTVLAAANARADAGPPPPLDGARIFGGLLLGGLTSVAGGVIGGVAGYGVVAIGGCGPPANVDGNYDGASPCTVGAVIGAATGAIAGAPVGVYLLGSSGDETGSFVLATGAAMMGGVAAAAVSRMDEQLTIPLFIALPTLGATVGSYASRRYKADATPVAMISKDRSVFGFAVTF